MRNTETFNERALHCVDTIGGTWAIIRDTRTLAYQLPLLEATATTAPPAIAAAARRPSSARVKKCCGPIDPAQKLTNHSNVCNTRRAYEIIRLHADKLKHPCAICHKYIGKRYTGSPEPSDSITFKASSRHVSIPADQQRLIFAGKQLAGRSYPVPYYNIQQESHFTW